MKLIEDKCHVDTIVRAEMLLAFANYWGQKPETAKKALWEKQKTFDLFARIRNWKAKEDDRRPEDKAKVEAAKTAERRKEIEAREKAEQAAKEKQAAEERAYLLRLMQELPTEQQNQIRKEAEDAIAALRITKDKAHGMFEKMVE